MAHLSQEEQLKLITDLEIEMMADMYNRYTVYGITVVNINAVTIDPVTVKIANWLLIRQPEQ